MNGKDKPHNTLGDVEWMIAGIIAAVVLTYLLVIS